MARFIEEYEQKMYLWLVRNGRGEAVVDAAGTSREIVKPLFELVYNNVNNRRAAVVEDANSLLDELDRNNMLSSDTPREPIDKRLSTVVVKDRIERVLTAVAQARESTMSDDMHKKVEALTVKMNALDADGLVGSIGALALSARPDRGEPLVIGLQKDFLPGFDENGTGTMRDAMGRLTKEIERLKEECSRSGVILVHENGADLAGAIMGLDAVKNGTAKLSNIVIYGAQKTICNAGPGDTFRALRGNNKDGALFAAVDTDAIGECITRCQPGQVPDIKLLEMLCMAMEVASGKVPPEGYCKYDEFSRVLTFMLKIKPVDWVGFRDECNVQAAAMQAA